MCVSQGLSPASLTVVVTAMLLLSTTHRLAHAALHIPENYNRTGQNMSQPPVLIEMPWSYTAFSKEDIHLPCEATGNPPPTFRWLKDGEEFGTPREGSGTLRAEPEPEQEGSLGSLGSLEEFQGLYRCYASNLLGTAITPSVRVIVEAQPVLLKQQKVHKKLNEGEAIILTCNPPQSSTPPLIHWMDKKMVHIRQSERVMVGLDGNLYFSNVVQSDSRTDYICNAQYSAARTILPDTAVKMTVVPNNDVNHSKKPHFFRPSGSTSYKLALRGDSLTLECIPKGLPTPKVEWMKTDGSLMETSAQLDKHNRWLHFESISQQDDGMYECKATNEHGSATHSFTVTVEAAPYWVKEPQNQHYAPGETVRLDCQAEGIPSPQLTWSINGQPLTEVDSEPRRTVTGGALIIRDVIYSDNAVYQCEASNKHGTILSNAFLYVVYLPPQILSSDRRVYKVVEGGDVHMHCEAFGSPRPHVTWEGGSEEPLLSDPRVSLLTNGTLTLGSVALDDRGTFTCSIHSANISIGALLEVYNQTVIVDSPGDVRVLLGSKAELLCGFETDDQLLKVQVVWKKDRHKIQESSPDDKYTVLDNGSLRVSNVQSEDSGPYSCEVITEVDHVTASGSITVVAPPDSPIDLSLSEVKDRSLTLSWIPGHSHNSPITEFIVDMLEEQRGGGGGGGDGGAVAMETGRWDDGRRVPADFNHLQISLRPYCLYRFRVRAVNGVGESLPSQATDSHTTPPAVPFDNPTGVRSDSSEPNTMLITWDEVDRLDQNGPGFQYAVSWREAGGDGGTMGWEQRDVASPPLLVNATGTFKAYEIRVQAVNALGAAPDPPAQTGHSGEDVPEEAPTGVVTMVTNNTVKVSWSQAQNVRGHLLGYKIYIRRLGPQTHHRGRRSLEKHRHHHDNKEAQVMSSERDERGGGGVEIETERVETVHGVKTEAEVKDLRFYSRYEISVTTFNKKGESPRSPDVHFHTPEGPPGPPSSLHWDSPTNRSLVLSWTKPHQTNGPLTGYMVQYQQESQSRDSPVHIQPIRDPAVTHLALSSLDPSSYYLLEVRAQTAAGDGPPITRRGATMLDGAPPTNITIVSGNTFLNLSWTPGERERNHAFTIRYINKSPGGQWEESELVNSSQASYWLTGLKPGSQYHLMIMQGENKTHWDDSIWTMGPVPSEMPGGFANKGWLIGLITAILLLVLILLILCLIKRSKGGKYAVKDKEDKEVDSEARPMKDETFGEYRSLESDVDEKRSDSQPSLCVDSKRNSDDSLAEYGGSVDIQFNEDGSFIGQYSNRGGVPVAPGNHSSGPASPNAPPPPIGPSMSSILNNRPA